MSYLGVTMTGFKQGEYGSYEKIYVRGLIKASLQRAITGERGYVLYINKLQFKKRFQTVDEAEAVADSIVKKRIVEYLTNESE